MTIVCQHIHTPMGTMLLAARDEGLVGVWFDGQRHLPDTSGWSHRTAHPVLKATETQLLQYMQGERQTFDLPLCPAWGTPFQQTVWQALRGIDFGRVTSYGQMAIDLNRPQAARAIGAAVGRNPWSVVVPCHRVLGSQGRLTGYAGGLDRKLALLTLEGVMH